MKYICICVFFFIMTAGGFAEDYFVAPNGSDRNSGTLEKPFRTIGKAVRVLKAGDTCYIRGGRYHEEVILKAEVDLNEVKSARERFPALADRLDWLNPSEGY